MRECSPPPNMSRVMCPVSRVTCHVSRVTCHVSHVTCHMSHVTCHFLFYIIFFLIFFFIYFFIYFLILFFFGQSGEAYRWRVSYQRGLPRLVYCHVNQCYIVYQSIIIIV